MMSTSQRLALATLFSVLTGCGTLAPAPSADDPDTSAQTQTITPPPEVALDSKLLFQLLIAEFSGQKGALRLSAQTYLQAAQQTRDYRLARQATRVAVFGRDTALALQAAQLWVELEPQSSDAHKALAALLIDTGKTQQATPHLKPLLQTHPIEHAYLLVADLLSKASDPQQAMQQLETLLHDAERPIEALYARAHLAYKIKQHSQALALLEQLLQQEARHQPALILQARALSANDQSDAALRSMHRALQLTPQKHTLRLTYARMLIDARKMEEARRQFRLLTDKLPKDPAILYALGLLAQEAGDLDDAEQQFKALLQLGQREEESRLALGQIAEARQQPEQAIRWYSEVSGGEHYLEAQLQAARLIEKQQNLEAAQQHLQGLIFANPEDDAKRFLAEGQLLEELERHPQAAAVYDRGLQQYPGHIDLLYARALNAEKLNRLDILERDLKAILKREPENTQTLNALGYTLVDRTKRIKEGFKYIQRAHQQRPDDLAILDSMGWALYRLGRLDEALNYLKRAAARVQDGEIAAHLGEVLWFNGQRDEARKVWEAARKFAPDHKVLQRTLQRLLP